MSQTSHRIRIHGEIRARLLRGEIAPQDRLVDHAIAAQMGVSRMPVREALMQLASEGYLDRTSRGFALPNLGPQRIEQVFVLRRLLEPHAAACAARDRSPAQLDQMRQASDACTQAQDDVLAVHRAAEVFRNTWLGAVQNAELRQAIQRYSGQVQSVRFATLPDPAARRVIQTGLSAHLAAFAAQDGPAAADLMLRFIYDAENSYRQIHG